MPITTPNMVQLHEQPSHALTVTLTAIENVHQVHNNLFCALVLSMEDTVIISVCLSVCAPGYLLGWLPFRPFFSSKIYNIWSFN